MLGAYDLAFGIVVAIILAVLALIMIGVPAPFWVTLGIVTIAGASSSVLHTEGSVLSIGLRASGLALIMVGSFIRPPLQPGSMQAPVRESLRKFPIRILVPISLYILFATLAHGQAFAFAGYAVAIAVLGFYLRAICVGLTPRDIKIGVTAALATVVSTSLIAGLLNPTMSIEQGRLRGVAENPNGLGCYAFVLGALAIINVGRRPVSALLVSLSVTTIVWTGSRTSALALLMVIVIRAILRSNTHRLVLTTSTLCVAVLYYINQSRIESLLGRLLNGDNTRSLTFEYSIDTFRQHPLTGIGLGNEVSEVASSPMRAIVHAGIFGLIAIALIFATLLATGYSLSIDSLAYSLGVVTYSVFEGILLAPIGSLLLITLAAWCVVARQGGIIASENQIAAVPTPIARSPAI